MPNMRETGPDQHNYEPPLTPAVCIMGFDGTYGGPFDGIYSGASFRDKLNILKHTCIWPDGIIKYVTR